MTQAWAEAWKAIKTFHGSYSYNCCILVLILDFRLFKLKARLHLKFKINVATLLKSFTYYSHLIWKIASSRACPAELGKTVVFPLVGKARKVAIAYMEFVKGAIRKWVHGFVCSKQQILCVYVKLQTRPCTHFRIAPFKFTNSLHGEKTSWSTRVKLDKNNNGYPNILVTFPVI